MKICPRCQKTYSDDSLNFCLEDGSVLTVTSAPPTMDETLVMQPRPTLPQQPTPSQPGSQPAWNAPPPSQAASQPTWNAPPPQQPYSMQPAKKSSKMWIWVVLVLGLVALLCGGGVVGLFVVSKIETDTPPANVTYNVNKNPSPSATRSTTTTTTTSGRTDLTALDLHMFVKENSLYGTTEMNGDELTMGSLKKGFYYVLVAPEKYTTDDADTRVTLRNVADAASSLGYGLIFHSNPTPLQQDYAFLIDTKRRKYEVVHHSPQKEDVVKSWTASPAINGGTEENTLEVRDQTDKIELYINGTMVTSITNVYGYAGGVVGLYSGDGVKIAFKDLQIRK